MAKKKAAKKKGSRPKKRSRIANRCVARGRTQPMAWAKKRRPRTTRTPAPPADSTLAFPVATLLVDLEGRTYKQDGTPLPHTAAQYEVMGFRSEELKHVAGRTVVRWYRTQADQELPAEWQNPKP